MMDPRRPDPHCEPRITLVLQIPCNSEARCKALLEALRPDDVEAPEWLKIREEVVDNTIRVYIEAPHVRILSVRSTAEEILEYSYSLLRLLEKLSAAEGGEEIRSPSREDEE